METLSERDLALINALQIAPRVPWAQAAEILDAHPTALANRWERLRAAGLAWVACEFTGRARHQVTAFTTVACQPSQRTALARRFLGMPAVGSVDVFSQSHELALTVVAESMADLADTTFEEISSLDGVVGMHSLINAQVFASARDWRLGALDRVQAEELRRINREQTAPDPDSSLKPEHLPVLELLQTDGRCTAATVARETGVSPTTARRHLAKVLRSDVISLRCDMAQQHSGYPVTMQWFARLPASAHAAASQQLASHLNVRLVSSCIGSANFLVAMWLASVNDAMAAERAIEQHVPGIRILEGAVLMRSHKRMGWEINPDGTTSGRHLAMPISIA